MPMMQGREVNIPDELRADRVVTQEEQAEDAMKSIASVVGALVAIFMLLVGTAGIGFGVGLWIHPGAGIAAAGLVLVVVGLLIGFQV